MAANILGQVEACWPEFANSLLGLILLLRERANGRYKTGQLADTSTVYYLNHSMEIVPATEAIYMTRNGAIVPYRPTVKSTYREPVDDINDLQKLFFRLLVDEERRFVQSTAGRISMGCNGANGRL